MSKHNICVDCDACSTSVQGGRAHIFLFNSLGELCQDVLLLERVDRITNGPQVGWWVTAKLSDNQWTKEQDVACILLALDRLLSKRLHCVGKIICLVYLTDVYRHTSYVFDLLPYDTCHICNKVLPPRTMEGLRPPTTQRGRTEVSNPKGASQTGDTKPKQLVKPSSNVGKVRQAEEKANSKSKKEDTTRLTPTDDQVHKL